MNPYLPPGVSDAMLDRQIAPEEDDEEAEAAD